MDENFAISYAILTHNEDEDLQKLLEFLVEHKDEEDEIVILDDFSDNPKTQEIIEIYTPVYGVIFEQRMLLEDFGGQKNHLTSMCKNPYIMNIDADELMTKYFMENIKEVLKINSDVDLFWFPRINVVNGLTLDHIKKWNWNIGVLKGGFRNEVKEWKNMKNVSDDLYAILKHYDLIIEDKQHYDTGTHGFEGMKFYTPLVNWPDYQGRLYKKAPNIRWSGNVHERIVGHAEHTQFPLEVKWAIRHTKSIDRQEQQNEFYETIL